MGVRLPPFAPFFSFNNLRLILVCATFLVVNLRLRLGCVLLRGGELVQAIDEAAEGYRFSDRQLVDREYKLVRCGYFIRTNSGQLVRTGQDWGPLDPVFDPGNIYPGGPRN
jgi:hypothetical protein